MARRPTALVGCVLGLAVALASAGPAVAAFTLAAPATAAFAYTLTGTDGTATFTLPLTVTDTRASPSGWNVTIRATQFTAGAKTLPTTADSVTSVTPACATGPCLAPTNSIGLPVTVPITPGAKFFNAASPTGTGGWTITPTVTVTIPGNTLTGSYVSTVTTALVAGP